MVFLQVKSLGLVVKFKKKLCNSIDSFIEKEEGDAMRRSDRKKSTRNQQTY